MTVIWHWVVTMNVLNKQEKKNSKGYRPSKVQKGFGPNAGTFQWD